MPGTDAKAGSDGLLTAVLTVLVLLADKVAELGPQVAEALSTKGGGRPGVFQGKASSLNGLPRALKILHQNWGQPSRTSIGCAVSQGWHSACLLYCANAQTSGHSSVLVDEQATTSHNFERLLTALRPP